MQFFRCDAGTFTQGDTGTDDLTAIAVGHTDRGSHLLDTHSRPIRDEVWQLYRFACRRMGAVATLVEWDEDIPEWDVLEAESLRAREEQRAAGVGA